jgi:cyanate permease
VGAFGIILFVFGPWLPLIFLGGALWGVGVSVGFPVGMSAAADDPELAAVRVSVISSIAYVGFLVGPPFVGLLGDQFDILRALMSVLVALLFALLLAGIVKDHRVTNQMEESPPPS